MPYPVIPSVEMRAILATLADGCSGNPGASSSSSGGLAGSRLCNLTLRLFVNDIFPGLNTTWADMVEGSFPGYLPFTPITWSLPFTDILGVSQMFGGCHLFAATGPVPGQTGYGWMLTREDGGRVLVAAQRFAAPVGFTAAGAVAIAEVYFALIYPPSA